MLDPKGASGYDVSSSDLRDELGRLTGCKRPSPRAPSRAQRPAPSGRAPRGEAERAASSAAARSEPIVSPEDSFSGMHEELADEAEFAPLAGDELDESSLEVLEPPRPARARAPRRRDGRAPLARTGRRAPEPLLEALAPQLRAQLHDTLEKIAWESFSSVTEQIVRQALERVEAIAWEVIPQMAETLVREEIRRMKGEPTDPPDRGPLPRTRVREPRRPTVSGCGGGGEAK